mgnify:CR=1 FL=1
MTTDEQIQIYDTVSEALDRAKGESLLDAATRIMKAPHGDRRWRVAREVMGQDQDQWRALRRAAKSARRLRA